MQIPPLCVSLFICVLFSFFVLSLDVCRIEHIKFDGATASAPFFTLKYDRADDRICASKTETARRHCIQKRINKKSKIHNMRQHAAESRASFANKKIHTNYVVGDDTTTKFSIFRTISTVRTDMQNEIKRIRLTDLQHFMAVNVWMEFVIKVLHMKNTTKSHKFIAKEFCVCVPFVLFVC